MRTKLAPIWHKLTIFGARALAAGVLSPYVQAMHAIKSGLEQDLNALPAAEMAEWTVKVACAWLSHGGAMPLLWWAKENMGYGNVEDERNSITRGLLYHGPAIMCFDRWNFWLYRLQVLAEQESGLSDETRLTLLDAAANTMREAEERLTR